VISITILFGLGYLLVVIVQCFVHFSCYLPTGLSKQAPGVPAEQLPHHKRTLWVWGHEPSDTLRDGQRGDGVSPPVCHGAPTSERAAELWVYLVTQSHPFPQALLLSPHLLSYLP